MGLTFRNENDTVIDRFESYVQGIPCKVDVTYYSEGYVCKRRGHPDTWEEDEQPCIEYDILDRRGRPAPWLESKATDDDHDRIFQEAMQHIKESNQ